MKRRVKILIICLASILLLFMVLFIFKASIVGYFLRTALERQSNGDITLSIEDISIKPISNKISLIKPNLIFKNAYLDSAQTIILTNVSFDKIEIDKLNFSDLFFKKLLLAERLIVEKPGIYFIEETGKEQFSIHPEKLFASFGQDTSSRKDLSIAIGDVEIHYGSIRITQDTAQQGLPEIVDFTIILENFNTNPEPAQKADQILFSDDVQFEIKNLHKLFISGYHLSVDSIHFSTKKKRISLSGTSLIPDWFEDKGKNRIALSVKQVELNGINLKQFRGKEDLDISSVIISTGYFSEYLVDTTPTRVDTARAKGKHRLSETLHQFSLDTFVIDAFQYNLILSDEDTAINVNDIDLSFYNILIDSAIFRDPLSKVFYKKVLFSTGSSDLNFSEEQMSIHYDTISYVSEDGQLMIRGADVRSKVTGETSPPLVFQVQELFVNKLYPELLQSRQFSSLSIVLEGPYAEIDFNHPLFIPDKNKSQGKTNLSGLPEIKINNGQIRLSKAGEFLIELDDFSAHANKLDLSNGMAGLNYEGLWVQSNRVNASIQNNYLLLQSGPLTFKNSTLGIKDFIANINTYQPDKKATVRVKEFQLSEIQVSQLFTDKKLLANTLLLDSPVISGDIDIPVKDKASRDTQLNPGDTNALPLNISLQEFNLEQGLADASFYHNTDTFQVHSGFAVHLKNINLDSRDSLQQWIDELKGNIAVEKTRVHMLGHAGTLDELFLDFNTGKFKIQSLDVYAKQGSNTRNININSFNLSTFDFTGLRFDKLIKFGQLKFRKLVIDDLSMDVKMREAESGERRSRATSRQRRGVKWREAKPSDIPPEAGRKAKDKEMKRPFDFRYDTILWTDMHFKFEYISDSAHGMYSVKNLDIRHKKDKSIGDNLMRKIQFTFDDFELRNRLDNSYLVIKHGHSESNKLDIIIDSVKGGNFIKVEHPLEVEKGSKTMFQCNRILLKGFYLKDTIPTKLVVGRLDLDQVDLSLIRDSKHQSKPGFKFDIAIFRKYAYLMTALSVDTTMIRDAKLRYRTTDDTSSHLVWADSIGLIINNINIDTTMFHEDDPDLINNLSVDFKGRSHISKDSLYEVQSGRFHYNFPLRRITIDSLQVTPRFEETEFYRKSVYQTDRMEISGRQIVFNDFHIDELINDNKVHFGSLNLYNINFRLVRDKRYPIEPGKRTVLPRDGIMGIGQTITIDSINIVDSYLEYGEYSEKSELPGIVHFDQVNLKAHNFTNDLSIIDEKTQFSIKLDARIMGQAKMYASLYFDLLSPDNTFWFTARSEELDLTSLNPLTKNVMGIFITSGKGRLDAPRISGNDSLATGTLMFRYKKFKLAMYDQEKSQVDHGILAPIVNFLINDIMIISNNPRFIRKERTGLVYFERDHQKSVANYVWKSILSGMISTAGFNSKEQRQEKRELKEQVIQ